MVIFLKLYWFVVFYLYFLDEKVSISDLEDVDPDLAKNLVWLLDNDIGDGLELGMDFRFLKNWKK